VTRQRARAAAELEDDTSLLTNRLEQCHDARCASISMEPVPQLVHEGEIAPVVRRSDDDETLRGALPAAPHSPSVTACQSASGGATNSGLEWFAQCSVRPSHEVAAQGFLFARTFAVVPGVPSTAVGGPQIQSREWRVTVS
jgi:hypothetical protein